MIINNLSDYILSENQIDLKQKVPNQKQTIQLKELLQSNQEFTEIHFDLDIVISLLPLTPSKFSIGFLSQLLKKQQTDDILIKLFQVVIEWELDQKNIKVENGNPKNKIPSNQNHLLSLILNQSISKIQKRSDFNFSQEQLQAILDQIIYLYQQSAEDNLINLKNLTIWTEILIDSNFIQLQLKDSLKLKIKTLFALVKQYDLFQESINNVRTLQEIKLNDVTRIQENTNQKRVVTHIYF